MAISSESRNVSTGEDMSRRLRRRPAATTAVGVGAAALILTGLGLSSASAVGHAKVVTIRFVSVSKKSVRVPTGGADIDVDHNSAGKAIGSDTLNCRGTTQKNIRCSYTVDLPGGDLLGAVTPSQTGGSGRVLDGTGRYAGATGTITATDVTALKTNIVIELHR